jgi:hypothetical protein
VLDPYSDPATLTRFIRIIRESLSNFDDLDARDRFLYRQGVAAGKHDPCYSDTPIPTRRKNRHPPLVRVLTR